MTFEDILEHVEHPVQLKRMWLNGRLIGVSVECQQCDQVLMGQMTPDDWEGNEIEDSVRRGLEQAARGELTDGPDLDADQPLADSMKG